MTSRPDMQGKKYWNVDGRSMAYVNKGSGPPVFLLRGNSTLKQVGSTKLKPLSKVFNLCRKTLGRRLASP